MPRLPLPFAALLLAAGAAALSPAQSPAPAPIAWQNDLTVARALAKQLHKPLFVAFRCER